MSRRRSNGDGGVYRRASDGRWVASLDLDPDGGPTRRRKVPYGATRREVVAKLREAQQRLADGASVEDSRILVGPFLTRWSVEGLGAANIKATTQENYAGIARTHLVPTLGHLRLDRLAPSDVDRLLAGKRQRGLSDSTVRLIYTVLRRALDHAARDGLVRRNVAAAVSRPTVAHRDAAVLSPAQAQTLLEAARGQRLCALYAVAMAAGLRRGEALALRWSDVDLHAATLRVSRTLSRTAAGLTFTEPKPARSRRTIPLPASLVDELRAHRTRQLAERLAAGSLWRDHDLVFPSLTGTPLDPRNALRAFTATAERAGLAGIGLHTLRHTCASLLLAQGVHPRIVMETLGHSGISITMDTYSHVMPPQQREAADRMEGALQW
uniref:Phage integrase n=1 Tax=uncultured Nocardioidaceae bacterium TaxID=253824 RepID=A0A6J4KSV4_9ACTN|nr:MAG: Phage integrase [uncultured Nocardioidaceae bacterium]